MESTVAEMATPNNRHSVLSGARVSKFRRTFGSALLSCLKHDDIDLI